MVTSPNWLSGKSRAELKYRAQFAATYESETELANALANCESWASTIRSLKLTKDAADNVPAEPPVAPEGKFSTFVADPPWQNPHQRRQAQTARHPRRDDGPLIAECGLLDPARCECPLDQIEQR